MLRRLAPYVLLTVTLACADEAPLEPAAAEAPDAAPNATSAAAPNAVADVAAARAERLSVLTRNLYVGADVDAVIGALASPAPEDDLPALAAAIETLGRTDFPTRAHALADEVARARPHVVGLQEVSRIDIDLTPLQIPVALSLDFLPILQQALADRGLHYSVAASVKNIEAAPIPGVSLVDFDAILVDADRVQVTGGGGHTYTANIGPVAPGVVLKRGWVAVEAVVGGRAYAFASTHLESGGAAGLGQLRAAQASELAGALPSGKPTILMGDFNDQPGSNMYLALTGAGFTDVWRALRPGVRGYTCCHAADLSDHVAELTQRIDYVFSRGPSAGDQAVHGSITRTGSEPSDLVGGPAGPIWPSDHAGLAATLLQVPQP